MQFYSQSGLIAIATTLPFFLAPLIHGLGQRRVNLLRFVDGLTLSLLCGLVVFHVFPESLETARFYAFAGLLAGFLLPSFLEHRIHAKLAHSAHEFFLWLSIFGLALHELSDGVVLAQFLFLPESFNPKILLALTLHRLPLGVVVWWLLKPKYKTLRTMLVLFILALASLTGTYLGGHLNFESHFGYSIFQALVSGSLLHVLLHRHQAYIPPENINGMQTYSGLGAIFGLIILVAGGSIEFVDSDHGALALFFQLAKQSAPSLALAYVAAVVLYVFVPSSINFVRKRGSHFASSLRGMLYGLPLPVCSCGVVPLYRELVKKGVPLSAAISFFVATPELGLDALLLTLPLLGFDFMVARLVCAALVALFVGYFIGYYFETTQTKVVEVSNHPLPFFERLKAGLRMGLLESVEHTAPWILVGLIISVWLEPLVTASSFLRSIPIMAQVPLFALVGLPIYVCASGATPMVATLLLGGLSPGAGLAFLLTGPATNVTTFGILAKMHGKQLAVSFALLVFGFAVLLGYVCNFFLSDFTAPALHEHNLTHGLGLWSLLFLILLIMIALIRKGPRFLASQIISFAEAPINDFVLSEKKSDCCHS